MNPIEFQNVTLNYGRKAALTDLSLSVGEGRITALLGPNGAGKSTAIKLMLGLLRASAGKVTTLGRDALKLRSADFTQIGYVSENQKLPDWMTVSQLLAYCRPLYPAWDRDLEARLTAQFQLPMGQKLKSLSRGQAMKAALLSSMAYRPKILILDEPFSGLDALSRDEFIGGLLELVAGESWTICVSSHDFHEVERLADHLAILNHGRLRVDESALSLQSRMRKIVLQCPVETPLPHDLPATWLEVERSGQFVRFIDSDHRETDAPSRLAAFFPGSTLASVETLTLREIFVCLSRQYRLESSIKSLPGTTAETAIVA